MGMAPPQSRAMRISAGLVALTALVGVALWPRLPAEMAIHFSASGRPDNYVSRAVGVGLMPVILVATLLIMTRTTRPTTRRFPPS